MSARRLASSMALALGVLVASCEDKPPPNVPTTPGVQPVPGQVPGIAPGVQVGVVDLPAADGTKMNDAARGAYNQGLVAFANGDLATAEAAFAQATLADPKSHQAFYSLGVVQERLGKAAAEASYQKAFGLQSEYEYAIVAYGLYLAKRDRLQQADTFLTERRGRMPKSAAVAAALAEVKSLEGDTGAAQQIAQEALKIDPDYRPAMVTIARDHYRNRRLDLALLALRAILDGFDEDNPARDRDNAEAHLLRGIILQERGERAAAMDAFTKAKTLRPDLVVAKLYYATYLLEAGDAAKALPELTDAVKREPDNLAARLAQGDANRLLGRYDVARSDFDWVASRDPNLAQVHYNLALLYLFAPNVQGVTAKQQVDAAIKELEKYSTLKKKSDADDSGELLQRAKLKKAEIEATEQAAHPTPVAPPDAGAPGAGGGAPDENGAADAG